MSQDAQSLFVQAQSALQSGQFEAALNAIDQAIALDPRTDYHVVRGVSLAQLGRANEAASAFQSAIAADPSNAKAFYNFATHMYQQGRKQEALAYAKQAVAKDPAHQSAADLVRLIESESAAPPVAATPPAPGAPYGTPPTFAQYPREQPPGLSNQSSVPFVRDLGPKWTAIGWGLSFGMLAMFLYMIAVFGPMANEFMAAFSGGEAAMQAAVEKMQTAVPGWYSPVSWLFTIGSIVWSILDIIDKRSNYLWLLPLILCTCCGLTFMVMPLYLLLGRTRG
jgi:tetratricopeptide (TPR) repeat protein